jgi:acyl-coenzyme A thioesterase PaaI-like protein
VRSFPPYAQLLKLRIDEGEQGPLVVLPFHDDVVGRPGYLHGGAIAGLLEFAAFTTLWRELGDDDAVVKPITVTVDYMRGAGDHDTFASAIVERLGARIANVEAFAWQKDPSSPIAAARINFLLRRPGEGREPSEEDALA